MKRFNYRGTGANEDRISKDDVSKIFYEAAKLTWENRKGMLGEVVEIFEDFSGLRGINVGGLPADTYMSIGFDGVGTKIELCERIAKHDTIAYDLFAMVCDDAVVRGAEPIIIGSILDIKNLNKRNKSHTDFVKQLAAGYVDAARKANVAVINGEVAELEARVNGYGEFNYNWGAGIVWFARKSRMLTGYEIKTGDKIVGLKENGFRSNGLSLVRKIMKKVYGDEWHNETYKGKNIAELALHPSRIYSKAVVDMFGGFDREPKTKLHGVSHITGGGIPEKLSRTLRPSKLGAYLYNLFEPCELMKYCQEKGNVADTEAYKTWNMGQGMIIITPNPDEVINVAGQHEIESKIIGEITKEPTIKILNKGINSGKQKILEFKCH
jgi:phosphoribosylformylglycinamidine cyclo-ligase